MTFSMKMATNVVMVIATLLVFQVNRSHSKKYLASCRNWSYNNDCDSSLSLTCIKGKCNCVKPSDMTFQNFKCVVLAGKSCSKQSIVADLFEEPNLETFDCVDRAVCNSDKICKCKERFQETEEGFCVSKGKSVHGEKCTSSDQCLADKHLFCVDGVCSCNKTESVYDATTGKCFGLAGASCEMYENECAGLASCGVVYNFSVKHRFGNIFDKCSCPRSFVVSASGSCVANYSMACSAAEGAAPCREELACIDGKCGCHYPSHQYFDKELQKCVSFVGGPCSELRNGSLVAYGCVSKAHCVNLTGIHECSCEPGYIPSKARLCKASHGLPCTGTGHCSATEGLICYDGFCRCNDFQRYNKERGKCEGLLMAVCDLKMDGDCVDGAYCDKFFGPKFSKGVCRCNNTTKVNPDRGCTPITDSNYSIQEAPAINL